jgi:ABC-type branched-chain amino acid transport system, permease component
MAYSVLQKGIIMAVVAVSMNLITGFTGLFSLGQAGFMAIGAYVTAIFLIPTEHMESVYYIRGASPVIMAFKVWLDSMPSWFQALTPYIALLIGGLIGALFAALIGIPVLRLKRRMKIFHWLPITSPFRKSFDPFPGGVSSTSDWLTGRMPSWKKPGAKWPSA